MRTGRYRLHEKRRVGWLRRDLGPIIVLQVEVDRPIDQYGNREVVWIDANGSDAVTFAESLRDYRTTVREITP